MIDWKITEQHTPPKDRLILATSGWGWRREDQVLESKVIKLTGVVIPASHYKFLKPVGAVVMLYWVDSDLKHLKDGGLWALAGTGAAWFQGFRWWSEANNPLTAEMMAEHDPTMLVQSEIPDVETMTPYVPGEAEARERKFRDMVGL